MIQLRFGILLFGYGNTQVAHGSVIPIFGGKCCKTVLGLRLNFYRTGQVLHCGIEHLHQHICSITSCFNLHIGTEKQVLRFINGHFAYILTQVAMLVEKPSHTLRNIRTFEERRQSQAEMVYSLFAVGLYLHILYNRELCQYQFAVVIFRNSRNGINLLICKQTILLHRILTVVVGKVILKVKFKFICQFRQSIIGNVSNRHAGVVRIVVGPHIA